MLKKFRSELAHIIALFLLIGLGFIKVLVPAYPHGVTIGAIVTLTLGLYGKRLIQKRPAYREKYDENQDSI